MFTLAIAGRPNVGKSTLFNRIAGKKLAIVDDTPGITRDWREAEGRLFDQHLRIIDTAGLEEAFDDSIEGRMRQQTERALAQADAVLFMVDGRAGITPLDEHFARWLRRQKIPVVLGVNKCENDRATATALAEAYRLGLGDPIALSAEHGVGMDNLYDALTPHFPEDEDDDLIDDDDSFFFSDEHLDEIEGQEDYDFAAHVKEEPAGEEIPLRIAIVGRPNVGKSTLMNAILGEERSMTGPEAGITRDAIAAKWTYKDRLFRLVDTAGMRKKAKIVDKIEKMSVDDSLRAIRLAQVVVLVLDGNAILDKQDLQIADHVIKEGRALIIALNKWDSVENKEDAREALQYKLDTSLAQIGDVPTVTMSALKGRGIDRLLDTVLATYALWDSRIQTGKMNRWLAAMESRNPAPLVGGRSNRLRYITQIKSRPPTFALWCARPKELPETYKRYLINNLRKDFNLPGLPVRLLVRTSKNPFSDK